MQSLGRGQGVTVTNDGATILKSLYIDNPAAKVLVGAAGSPQLTLPSLRMPKSVQICSPPTRELMLMLPPSTGPACDSKGVKIQRAGRHAAGHVAAGLLAQRASTRPNCGHSQPG